MHTVIYDMHLHAYEHVGGVMVTIVVHDPQKRTVQSDAMLRVTRHIEVEQTHIDPEKWVRDVLVAAAECL